MSETRQHAHEIIDHMSEAQLSTAIGLLEGFLDPVRLTILNAPIDDEPGTYAEKAEVEEAHELLKRNGGKGTEGSLESL